MKTLKYSATLLCAAATLLAGNFAQSQAPATPLPSGPLQRLEEIRVKNKLLIEKQTETLKLLEHLDLQSQQLKFMGKRT